MRIAKNAISKNHLAMRLDRQKRNVEFKSLANDLNEFYQDLIPETVKFDYSLGSIKYVEFYLMELKKEKLEWEDDTLMIMVAGSYIGEIIRRKVGGCWVRPAKPVTSPEDTDFWLEYELPNRMRIDPIAKVRSYYEKPDKFGLKRYLGLIIKQTVGDASFLIYRSGKDKPDVNGGSPMQFIECPIISGASMKPFSSLELLDLYY